MIGWSGFERVLALAGPLASALVATSGLGAQPAPAETCPLALPAHYVGARAVSTVRSVIRAISKPAPIRWIAPGRGIRPDANPQRLNVILDEHGRIMAMRCG